MGVKSSHFLPEKERKFLFYSFVSVKSVNRALIPDKKKVFFCQSKNTRKEKLDTLAFVTFYHKICMYSAVPDKRIGPDKSVLDRNFRKI